MAIGGIVVSRENPPVSHAELEKLLAGLARAERPSSVSVAEPEVGLGGTSPVGTVSLWNSSEVLVVSDADVYNTAGWNGRGSATGDLNHSQLFGELYLSRGSAFLERVQGAFSIAVWDRRSGTLLLAVDRFGIKPLCYGGKSSDVVFASYPSGVLAGGRLERKVNPRALVDYLNFGVVPAPLCAFDGITKLLPGSYAIWKQGVIRTGRYWDMAYPEDLESSPEKLSQQLLTHLQEAVRAVSAEIVTSQLGCFLSGGTDSSSVVGLLTRIRKEPVTAISVGFAEERFDELGYAKIAANHFRSRHLTSVLGPDETLQMIPKIVEAFDEPYANASAIPTFHCQRVACEHGIRAMLAGDGGDELFGGNERYRTNQVYEIYHRIPFLLRHGLIEPFVFGAPALLPGIDKIRRYIRASNTANPDRYFRWNLLQYFNPDRILADDMPLRNGHGDRLASAREHYQAAPARSDLNRLLYLDLKMTLGDNDLPKVVRTADLAGMRVRFPYLEQSVVEFSGRVPAHLKVKNLEKRYLFREATRHLLPSAILKKKKHGFGLPIGLWLKTNPPLRRMAEETLLDPRTYQRGYFRRAFIEGLFSGMDDDRTPFYGDVLWQFLTLELWHRAHVEGKAS